MNYICKLIFTKKTDIQITQGNMKIHEQKYTQCIHADNDIIPANTLEIKEGADSRQKLTPTSLKALTLKKYFLPGVIDVTVHESSGPL